MRGEYGACPVGPHRVRVGVTYAAMGDVDLHVGRTRRAADDLQGIEGLVAGMGAKCFDCHFREDFTDDGFKNIGLFDGKDLNDSGHYNFKKELRYLGKFKTPGLRNVAVTAPYMHNGMFRTLEEVVTYYNDPGKIIPNAINSDPDIGKPLGLTEKEKKDLVAFLKTLTDKKFGREFPAVLADGADTKSLAEQRKLR